MLSASRVGHSAGPILANMSLVQVGAISGGVVAAEWSPEGEVLALVSGDAQLLLMSKARAARPPPLATPCGIG